MNLTEGLMVLALVVSICSLIYTLLTTRALLLRQNAIELRQQQVPSTKEFTDIRVQLASVEGKQEAVLAEAHGARAAIRRVEDFLLKSSINHDSKF
ncbi:hypothetical protein C6570_01160 [Ottowia oryzae]|uniref:Uncharacterized protein n=2 Tax=Ottowia oryzae TaxID=2109914 RepID=A0A2S0MAV9_9BURK|nr:hypothetical protein C6570_01160 [Ottowia oryzae]